MEVELEYQMESEIEIEVDGEPLKIKLTGIADRIDKYGAKQNFHATYFVAKHAPEYAADQHTPHLPVDYLGAGSHDRMLISEEDVQSFQAWLSYNGKK